MQKTQVGNVYRVLTCFSCREYFISMFTNETSPFATRERERGVIFAKKGKQWRKRKRFIRPVFIMPFFKTTHLFGLLGLNNIWRTDIYTFAVISLDFFDEIFHLFLLSLPFFLAHLGLFVEQLLIWLSVRSAESIP